MARVGLPAIRVKTEPRCKICMHPHRLDIEQMMVQQTKKEDDPEGNRVTIEYVQQWAMEKWDFYISMDNYRGHIEKHFCYREALQKAARKVAEQSDKLLQTTVLAEILTQLNAQDVLDEIIANGVKNLREDRGASVTTDHMLKAIDVKMKQQSDNGMRDILAMSARAANIGLDELEKKKGTLVDVEEGEVSCE